jgi:hypothetical protein
MNGLLFKKDRIGRLVFATNTFEGYFELNCPEV